jgi:hypothetical protein
VAVAAEIEAEEVVEVVVTTTTTTQAETTATTIITPVEEVVVVVVMDTMVAMVDTVVAVATAPMEAAVIAVTITTMVAVGRITTTIITTVVVGRTRFAKSVIARATLPFGAMIVLIIHIKLRIREWPTTSTTAMATMSTINGILTPGRLITLPMIWTG